MSWLKKITRCTGTVALAWMLVLVGCASLDEPSRPAAVPEIHQGILQGYLPTESLPEKDVVNQVRGRFRHPPSPHDGQKPRPLQENGTSKSCTTT